MNKSNIYRESLLEHVRNPRNLGSIDDPDLKAYVYNHLCGDELELNIDLSEGKIKDCKTKVRGCSICLASASMMTELIILKSLKEVSNISKDFSKCLKNGYCKIPKYLKNLVPLISLKEHKSRIKCISLAWDALADCLNKLEK